MSEITATQVHDNMAAYDRLRFVEEYPAVVGATALANYVDLAPDTGHALVFAMMLDEQQGEE